MKKAFLLFAGIIFIFTNNIFAQSEYDIDEDDIPYLDDDDIAAIETFLPEDVPEEMRIEPQRVIVEEPSSGTERNEMPRLNSSRTLYHLLILDRTRSPNSDISGLKNINVLYKYRHGRNGYLIAVYTSSREGPVFPELPVNSRILVDFVTTQPPVIRDYVNSSAFRRFVTNRTVLTEIQRALR